MNGESLHAQCELLRSKSVLEIVCLTAFSLATKLFKWETCAGDELATPCDGKQKLAILHGQLGDPFAFHSNYFPVRCSIRVTGSQISKDLCFVLED